MYNVSVSDEVERKFVREFKNMMNYRKAYMANNRAFAVENLPIPQSVLSRSVFAIENPGQRYALVHEVTEDYFSVLNEHYVEVCATNDNYDRVRLDKTGKPLLGSDGKPMMQHVTVPRNSCVIATTVNIHLPNYTGQTDANGEKERYNVTDKAFAYLTYKNNLYYYAVPQTVLYTAHPVSLILSARARRSQAYYASYCITLQNGGTVYLTTMPTERITNTTDMRIVCSKLSTDFTQEIKELWYCWQRTTAFKQADGREFHYCFTPQETVVNIDGVVKNLTFSNLSSTNTALDAEAYYATEQVPLSCVDNE